MCVIACQAASVSAAAAAVADTPNALCNATFDVATKADKKLSCRKETVRLLRGSVFCQDITGIEYSSAPNLIGLSSTTVT